MKDFADRIIDGIVYGEDKDKIPPKQKWGEEVEDDGENVKPRTEREWDEMDKGDDEYHASVDNEN